jgi:hypothetical protein
MKKAKEAFRTVRGTLHRCASYHVTNLTHVIASQKICHKLNTRDSVIASQISQTSSLKERCAWYIVTSNLVIT